MSDALDASIKAFRLCNRSRVILMMAR